MDCLYIIVPAYNESENIEAFVEEWYPIIESHSGNGSSRLVIINDGSKDNTYEKLLELTKTRPYLVPLTKPNGGHGSTLIYGYRYAISRGADYIFQTDSDRQTLPSEFESFWMRSSIPNSTKLSLSASAASRNISTVCPRHSSSRSLTEPNTDHKKEHHHGT